MTMGLWPWRKRDYSNGTQETISVGGKREFEMTVNSWCITGYQKYSEKKFFFLGFVSGVCSVNMTFHSRCFHTI